MNNRIISVSEAKAILDAQVFERRISNRVLAEAIGCVLAQDIHARVDVPAFSQSSMDGYAFAFDGWQPATQLAVRDVIAAGHPEQVKINLGEAARIFTGAPLPEGADTVVMQEQTLETDGQLDILQQDLKKGDNMRLRGAEIRSGELALPEGTLLTPAAIGFLAGVGYHEVPVYAAPRVAIVVTGDELQQPGAPLKHGQVYEASSVMLRGALVQLGISDITVYQAKDDPEETVAVLESALRNADAVLLTGGVSVGAYDFVVQAATRCGVKQLFHKILQRPGKPLFAGRKDNQPVFGLPGNPSSVLTCFYEYVWPVLRHITGHNDQLVALRAPLAVAHDKNNRLTHFLKGEYRDGRVTILPAQESYRMRSFAVANCLVVLGEAMRKYEENEPVDIHLLPG